VALTGEARELIDRLTENCEGLAKGYTEEVEQTVKVAYHSRECKYVGTAPKDCSCPVMNEKRTRRVPRKPLLEQLEEWQANCEPSRLPKAERGAPRVKTPKLHPELRGLLTLDEIVTDAYRVIDRALEEVGRDRTWTAQKATTMIGGLPMQAVYFVDEYPDVVRRLIRKTSTWLRSARSTLMITTGESIFDKVVCGNCGGGLSSPYGNRGEDAVRCVGSPESPPCGETYPPSEWITLYEQGAIHDR